MEHWEEGRLVETELVFAPGASGSIPGVRCSVAVSGIAPALGFPAGASVAPVYIASFASGCRCPAGGLLVGSGLALAEASSGEWRGACHACHGRITACPRLNGFNGT